MSLGRPRDYYTKTFRSEESIAAVARGLRERGSVLNKSCFNICDFFERVILYKTFKNKGVVKFAFLDDDSDEYPAVVTYEPLTLNIDREVWGLAQMDDPDCRHVVLMRSGILHYIATVPKDSRTTRV